METKNIKISELKPAAYNPREISEFDLEELQKSLTKFGMVEPAIVNKDMTIIGGHQRVKAAQVLGWTEVPCTLLDLDKRQEKALNLALNKIQGYFDEEKLSLIIQEIQNDAIGFSEEEVNQYTLRAEIKNEAEGTYDPDDDEALKKLFERNEKVAVGVEEPGTPMRSDKMAFYIDNFEDYQKIKEHFQTTRKGELDKSKLLDFVDSTIARKEA